VNNQDLNGFKLPPSLAFSNAEKYSISSSLNQLDVAILLHEHTECLSRKYEFVVRVGYHAATKSAKIPENISVKLEERTKFY